MSAAAAAPAAARPAAARCGLLEGRALACRRGRRRLFENLSLALEPGSITWLRGTNGSGKTSLMRILAGLSAPAAGQVLWDGRPLAEAGRAARDGTLYIGHANALKDDLTLLESLAYLARLAAWPDPQARAARALQRLGLAGQRTAAVRTLSQGQRRRGALARLALDESPRAWILDEPYDALDTGATAILSALIAEQAARGGAVLLTSHQAVALPGLREFALDARP
ncbi:MAG: cytochrome c biogenesis heme-transporting ATPase CcmA [Burkholderiales bacterium]|nr:cytochrome c biogenesis heme-transporting ATPase CcmA [Burkholderiales bacterium]